MTDARRAAGRDQAVVVGHGRRLRRHADARRSRCPPGTRDAELPGPLEHRGLRPRRRATTRYVEVDDGDRLQGDPGLHHQGRRGQRHRRLPGGWVPATFDLSAYAGKTVALRLHYRPTAPPRAPTRREPPASSPTTSSSPRAATTVFTDGAESGNNGWTPDGFTAVGATRSRRCTTTSTSRRTARTCPTTSTCRPGRTTSASRTRPDWVEHFPYQNGSARLLLGHVVLRQQHEPAPRRGRDPADRRAPAADLQASTASRGAAGSRPTTRRSRWRSPTRSRCTRRDGQASYIRGQAAVPIVRRPQGVLGRGAARRSA